MTVMWRLRLALKLPVARMQVRRFCDEEALPQIDNLALPLAAHRSLWELIVREPGVLKIYFSGGSKEHENN
jgi:hypothetical protein